MTISLHPGELTALQQAQSDHMLDVCVIQTATETTDALYQRNKTWADGLPQQCGLEMTGGQRSGPDNIILLSWDASLRISKGTSVSQANRIKMLEMYGEPISEIVYEVRAVEEGPSGLVLRLKKLEPSA